MKYKYIEIGVSDFATLLKKFPNDIGISVEPIQRFLDNLPDSPKNIKVACAISNEDGEAEFYRIKDERIDDKTRYKHDRGMSCLSIAEGSRKRTIENRARKDRFEKVLVPTMTLTSLLQKYDVEEVEIFKVDTEGYDTYIMEQLVNTKLRPKFIKFEVGHSSPQNVAEVKKKLVSLGYIVTKEKWDMELTLK
jgi:FkbM family methyltransferase